MKIQNNDSLIDFAIESHPLVELPDGFTTRTMTAIREMHPQIRPRLHFIDFVLPLFFSFFSLTLFSFGFWIKNELAYEWFEHFKLELNHIIKVIFTPIGFEYYEYMLGGMMILLIVSLSAIWLIYRPRRILRI